MFIYFMDDIEPCFADNGVFVFWYSTAGNDALTLEPPNYSIWLFTHLKLCLADAIHNFKWVKIIQIWQNGGQLFSNIADWCHILSLSHV